MKILSIIGIVISGIFLPWSLIAIFSEGRVSMEEFGPVLIIFGLFTLALSIVGLIYTKKRKSHETQLK